MYNHYWVYILSNYTNSTLYIGVTDNLERRTLEHRSRINPGFAEKYHCDKLVYYEEFSDINQAIDREKQLKRWSRSKKDWLIDQMNKDRDDLMKEISPLASLGRNDNNIHLL